MFDVPLITRNKPRIIKKTTCGKDNRSLKAGMAFYNVAYIVFQIATQMMISKHVGVPSLKNRKFVSTLNCKLFSQLVSLF